MSRMTGRMEPGTKRRGRSPNIEAGTEVLEAIGMGQALERGETAPLWVQLRNRLERTIEAGDFGDEGRLPSEQVLAESFGVSRPVVRAAIAALVAEGRLVTQPRRGTFVARRPDEDVDFVTSNLSVFDDLVGRGSVVTTRTFRFEEAEPTERESRFLALAPGARVLRIGRIYYRDGNPLTLTNIAIPSHKVPGMATLDMENRSIFGTIRERYGLFVVRSERWFRAVMPKPDERERLGLPADEPAIAIESIAYGRDGAPIEFYDALFNSSISRIHVKAEGAGPSNG